jgi:hypothetical protein
MVRIRLRNCTHNIVHACHSPCSHHLDSFNVLAPFIALIHLSCTVNPIDPVFTSIFTLGCFRLVAKELWTSCIQAVRSVRWMKKVKPEFFRCIPKKTIVQLIHDPNSKVLALGEHLTPLRSLDQVHSPLGWTRIPKTRLVCLRAI